MKIEETKKNGSLLWFIAKLYLIAMIALVSCYIALHGSYVAALLLLLGFGYWFWREVAVWTSRARLPQKIRDAKKAKNVTSLRG